MGRWQEKSNCEVGCGDFAVPQVSACRARRCSFNASSCPDWRRRWAATGGRGRRLRPSNFTTSCSSESVACTRRPASPGGTEYSACRFVRTRLLETRSSILRVTSGSGEGDGGSQPASTRSASATMQADPAVVARQATSPAPGGRRSCGHSGHPWSDANAACPPVSSGAHCAEAEMSLLAGGGIGHTAVR